MTQQTANSRVINNAARCQHFYPNGTRCRLHAINSNSNFCPTHAPLPANQPDAAEIVSTLTANLTDFTSASQINDFLSRLLLLLAQDRISTRRAAVLAYITNQLLRTLPAIAKEDDPENTKVIYCKGEYCRSDDAKLRDNCIIFDLPGPDSPPARQHPSSTDVPNQDRVHAEAACAHT